MEEKPIQDADGGNCYSVLTFCYGKMDEPAARNSDFFRQCRSQYLSGRITLRPSGSGLRFLFPTPISFRCVITVLPWIPPRIRRLPETQLNRQRPAMHSKRLRKPARSRLFEAKIRPGIARFARSGWNRVGASWSARSAVITCPARTTT